jgi:hypothetical protein
MIRDAMASNANKDPEEKLTQAKVAGESMSVTMQPGNYNNSASQQVQEPASKQPGHIGEKDLFSQSDTASVAENKANQDGSDPAKQMSKTIRDTEMYKKLGTRYVYANAAGRSIINANWRSVKVVPRGCIVVSGPVSIETSLDLITMQVMIVWDPKTREIDIQNSSMGVIKRARKKAAPFLN